MDVNIPQPATEVALPDVLTVAQAAALLNMHREAVSDLCEAGLLPARDIGTGRYRYWRISRRSIQDFLSQPQIDRSLLP